MSTTVNARVLHFHSNNHIGLTFMSFRQTDESYLVGMSLAHRNDNGSRKSGVKNCLKKMLNYICTRQRDSGARTGSNGLYEVADLNAVKMIVRNLRRIEKNYGNSKRNQVYNKAFFDLFGLYDDFIAFEAKNDLPHLQ